jgi:hypothetical protein
LNWGTQNQPKFGAGPYLLASKVWRRDEMVRRTHPTKTFQTSCAWAFGAPIKHEKFGGANLRARRGYKLMVRKTHPTEDFSDQEIGNQNKSTGTPGKKLCQDLYRFRIDMKQIVGADLCVGSCVGLQG